MPSITGIVLLDGALIVYVASLAWHLGGVVITRLTTRSAT